MSKIMNCIDTHTQTHAPYVYIHVYTPTHIHTHAAAHSMRNEFMFAAADKGFMNCQPRHRPKLPRTANNENATKCIPAQRQQAAREWNGMEWNGVSAALKDIQLKLHFFFYQSIELI